MEEYITHSRDETVALGRRLAAELAPGSLIAFTGGLGAGKTAFCQGIAEGLGCTDPVSSPTFAIVNYYRGPRPFAHFDLYRIHTEVDLSAAGFYDYLDMGAVVAAEWSENCADLLALENPIYINIDRLDTGHALNHQKYADDKPHDLHQRVRPCNEEQPHHNARHADRQQRRSHKGGALEGDGIDRTGSTGQQNQPANQRTKRNRGGTRLHDQVNAQHNADQRHQNQFPTDLFHKSSPSLWIAWADVRCAMQGAPAFYGNTA